MSNPADRVEIITSVQRRRRWTAAEKVRMVEETFEPGMTVSLVARRHGVAPNQLFTWRGLTTGLPSIPLECAFSQAPLLSLSPSSSCCTLSADVCTALGVLAATVPVSAERYNEVRNNVVRITCRL